MKWELDLWYELWDRAGSQGLDTWYDPRAKATGEHALPPPEADDTSGQPEGA